MGSREYFPPDDTRRRDDLALSPGERVAQAIELSRTATLIGEGERSPRAPDLTLSRGSTDDWEQLERRGPDTTREMFGFCPAE